MKRLLYILTVFSLCVRLHAAQTLNGSTDYFVCPGPFNGGGAVTAFVKVKFTSLAAESKSIAQWDDSGTKLEWLVTTSGGNSILVAIQHPGTDTLSGGSITTGVWYNICLRYDSANSSLRIFIDGTSVASTSTTGNITNNGARLSVGSGLNGSSPSAPLNGAIAEAAVWNVPLTDSEIASLNLYSAFLIRPAARKFYMDGIGPIFDWQGATITTNGAPAVSTHPILYLR